MDSDDDDSDSSEDSELERQNRKKGKKLGDLLFADDNSSNKKAKSAQANGG